MNPVEIQLILVVSIVLQCAAAFLALRLTRVTGPHRAWLVVAIALLLMALRRSISLYDAVYDRDDGLAAEMTALLTSILMLAGMASIAPLLRAIEKSRAVLRRSHTDLEAQVEARTAELAQINADLRFNEMRLGRLNECFLGFGPDPDANMNDVVALCGELLGATCALYNRLDDGLLCTLSQWQAPPGYNPIDVPDGHLCYDVIQRSEPLIVHNLQHSPYADSDPNVRAYGLQTYIGHPVRSNGQTVGSLCVVYQSSFDLGEGDRKLLGILAAALGTEEERKQIAEALRASETRYRTVVEDQSDLICRYRPDGTLTFANSAYCRNAGRPREDLLGKNFLSWVPESDHKAIQSILAHLTSDAPMSVAEHHTVTPEGETWKLWTRRAIYNEAGALVEYQAVGRDITEQKQAEQALRTSEERMRLAVQNLPVMVDAVDETGTIIMWNRECERVTGYSAEEMIGNPHAFELLFPDPAVRAHVQGLFKEGGGAFRDLEITLTCKDGSQRIVARSDVSKYYPIPGWSSWAVGIDITERTQTERALRQTQEQLEQRVIQRTRELHAANEKLTREIVERRRAETAEREQRVLAEALRDTAVVLNNTLDLDDVLKRLLHNVERVVPHDAADIMVVDGGIARLAYRQGRGADHGEAVPTFNIDRVPHLRRMIETGSVQLIPDTRQYDAWMFFPAAEWVRSHLSAPILLEGEIIGFLNLNSATPGAFTAANAERLQAFAAQAAAATRNARLYSQARQEITERQLAESRLAAQEAFLRQIIHATPSLIFAKDRQGRHTLVNEGFAEFFGTTVDHAMGKTDAELLPDRTVADKYSGQDRKVFETGETMVFTPALMTNRTTGEQRWYQSHKVPVTAPDGTITHVLGVMTDITEHKRIEAALRESEQRFRGLFESAAVGIAITTAGGMILEANPAMCNLLGYTLAELRTVSYADISHPDDLAAEDGMIAELISDRRDQYQIEKRYVRKDGGTVWARLTASVVRDLDGLVLYALGIVEDITARKQAQDELRESRERFRIISEIGSDFAYCFRVEPGGMVQPEWFIGAFESITSFSVDEMMAGAAQSPRAGWQLLIHPDDIDKSEAMIQEMIDLGVEPEIDYRIITKRGEVRHLRARHRAVWDDASGRVVRYYGSVQDITERKQAENELEAQRAFLRQIIDTNPSLIFVKDSEGRYVLANQAMARRHNTTVERMIGKTDADINPFKSEVARDTQQDQLVIVSRRALFMSDEIITDRHTGETRWYQGVKVPLSVPGSSECHVLGVATDISARKEAEDRVRQSEAALAAVIHAIPDVILRLDSQGVYLHVYTDSADLLAAPEDEIVGKTLHELLPPDVAAESQRRVDMALETDEVQVYEYPLQVPAGLRDFEARVVASGLDEVLVIIRDITSTKQARQRELLLLLEKERSRILNEFIRDAAQEFGTPLSVIKTSLYLLDRFEVGEKRARGMKMLNKQTAHIEKLVDGMLTTIRLDGEDNFTFEKVELSAMVEMLEERFSPAADQEGIGFEIDVEPDLPPVQADAHHLHRALSNLVDNAILYNRPGGTVSIHVHRQDDMAVFEVRDSGIGIAEEHMTHLFTRFFRADPAREKRGAGLGLAITRKIIEQHAGRVTAESTLGQGSVFKVWLPVSEPPASE